MTQITEIVASAVISVITILIGIAVQEVKKYLIARTSKRTVEIVEILARNAVNAVEQISKETGEKGEDKLVNAKLSMLNELKKYNVYMTEEDLTVFIESAVKQMNDLWGEV